MKRQLTAVLMASSLLVPLRAISEEPAPSPFLDPLALRVKEKPERPGDDVVAWGEARLVELKLAGLPAAERAARIARFVHETFGFGPDRPPTLSDFLAAKTGNCYAHARLSAFLLRLAGVPARFMYDVHLERKSPESTESARKAGIGLFGHWHNDHFWLLYRDGDAWIPFDSTLGIASRGEFLRRKIDEPGGGVANPPFLLWREGLDGKLENVTRAFWSELGRDTVPGVPASEWQTLLDTLGRLEVRDLRQPLSAERQAGIARVAEKFFAVPGRP